VNYLRCSRKANKLAKDEKKKGAAIVTCCALCFLSLSPLFPPPIYIYVFIFTWGGGGGRQLDAGSTTKGRHAFGAQEHALSLLTGGTFSQLRLAGLENGASTATSLAYNPFQQRKHLDAFRPRSFQISGQYLQFGFLRVPADIGTALSRPGRLTGWLAFSACLSLLPQHDHISTSIKLTLRL